MISCELPVSLWRSIPRRILTPNIISDVTVAEKKMPFRRVLACTDYREQVNVANKLPCVCIRTGVNIKKKTSAHTHTKRDKHSSNFCLNFFRLESLKTGIFNLIIIFAATAIISSITYKRTRRRLAYRYSSYTVDPPTTK